MDILSKIQVVFPRYTLGKTLAIVIIVQKISNVLYSCVFCNPMVRSNRLSCIIDRNKVMHVHGISASSMFVGSVLRNDFRTEEVGTDLKHEKESCL